MQPVDLSTQAQNLGPGTGGLFLGEQQRNAMQESELSQQNTLEQIAASKQKREFEGQLQPGAVEKQKLENTGLGLKNTGEQNKLDKDNYTNYSNDVIAYAAAGHSPMEIAAYQDQAAKRHKLDSSDERVRMVGGVAAQGPEAIAKWKEVLLHMDPKYREEMDKQRLANEGANTSASIHSAASIYGADKAAEASKYASDQRLAAAQKRAGTAQDIVQAAMLGKLSFEKAAVALEMLAQQSDNPDEAARLRATAKDMEQRNLNAANARNQGGGVSIGQGGITERPPQAVVPPTAPLRAPPGAPPMAPQGEVAPQSGLNPQEAQEMQQLEAASKGNGFTREQLQRYTQLLDKQISATVPGGGASPTPQPAAQAQQQKQFMIVDGNQYEVIGTNPDGSTKIRDPKTGKTGTVR